MYLVKITIMKQKILFLSLLFLPLLVSAQCKDCFQEDDWKFAAGVTLYSNNTYVSDINILERQPLELNFRYKIGRRHALRVSLPIPWKVNKAGEPTSGYSTLPNGEITLNEYLKQLHDHKSIYYSSYCKSLYFYESLSGISAGYDYNFPLSKSLSLFAGADLAYYQLAIKSKYYNIYYLGLDASGKSEIGSISLNNRYFKHNGYVIKPLLGTRYQFQKLMFEANVGYSFIKADNFYTGDYSDIENTTGFITSGPFYGEYHNNYKKFTYQFSLHYTF
jgi:hypothetical protein